MQRTPLAWRNLTHDLKRLALALAGIGFAVLLMSMELSFRRALFDSTVAVIQKTNADLILTSAAKYTIVVRETFDKRRLIQALACDGVESADPLYIETRFAIVKNPQTGEGQPIRVLAFDPDHPVFVFPTVNALLHELQLPDKVLFDVRSKPEYGDVEPGKTIELAERQAEVIGQFALGTDFTNDGNLITSDLTYRRLFPERAVGEDPLDEVDLGVLRVKPGQDPRQVQRHLQRLLPSDVTVFTKQEFEEQERRFWETSTPIGYVFWLGTLMGFIVGTVICYQILYADIADHLPEFATLKAMGYGNLYFVGVVLKEALWLSLLGFVPGIVVSQLICALVAELTGLLVSVHLGVAITVLLLSVGMCMVSGFLTMRRVMALDPADLF